MKKKVFRVVFICIIILTASNSRSQTIKEIVSPLITKLSGVNAWWGTGWQVCPIEGENIIKSKPVSRFGFSIKYGPFGLFKDNSKTTQKVAVEYRTNHFLNDTSKIQIGYEVTKEMSENYEYYLNVPISFGYQSINNLSFSNAKLFIPDFKISSFFASAIFSGKIFASESIRGCVGVSYSFDDLSSIQSQYKDSSDKWQRIEVTAKQIFSPEYIIGISAQFGDELSLFFDLSYKHMTFKSIKYSAINPDIVKVDELQANLPNKLDFSVVSTKLGFSLTIK